VADSKRKRILAALVARLEAIHKADGFNTDAGDRVFRGYVPQLGPDDATPYLSLIAPDDTPGSQMVKVVQTLSIDIYVVGRVDLRGEDPDADVEDGIADVKKAIELEDRELGGLLCDRLTRGVTRSFERESGTPLIGAIVAYQAKYTDVWGDPTD
jgi:hypothetical protein